MINILRSRMHFGNMAIKDIRKAEVHEKFRGLPAVAGKECGECSRCISICPAEAIELNPLRIDMGKCIFCGDCERGCEKGYIKYTSFHKISATEYKCLIIDSAAGTAADFKKKAVKINKTFRNIFGRSLTLRSVSAGGCNGCELELNACSNVNFDMGRFGINIAASPRHADGLIITGPITANMAKALDDTYKSIAIPKIVILAGSCAISGGLFAKADAVSRNFIIDHKIDLFVPGCPFHPLTLINGILDMMGG